MVRKKILLQKHGCLFSNNKRINKPKILKLALTEEF